MMHIVAFLYCNILWHDPYL